jgi:pseudo-response regulator 7
VVTLELTFFETQSSGSESGIQTQRCANPKAGDEYENNSDSSHDDDEDNDDDDDFSIGLNARDGSDNGSGTQVRDRLLLLNGYFLLL